MINVKLLCGRAGDGKSQLKGQVIRVSDDEGARMIAAGQAVAWDEPRGARVESMTAAPEMDAALRTKPVSGRRRR